MTSQDTGNVPPFRILAVCTGNLCRSPLVERLLQSGFNSSAFGWFRVASAGTRAAPGRPMDKRTADALTVLGGSPAGFISRQLTAGTLSDQDLVLALTREHRGDVVEISPELLGKTFTLRELARILPEASSTPSNSPAERWRNATSYAFRARSPHPVSPADDDVIDPYRLGDKAFAQMLVELTSAVDTLLNWEHSHG